MKKTICLILLIALLLPIGLFANGGSESGSSEEGGIKKITAVWDRILLEENGQKEWADRFKEITGVEIEIIKPVHNQYKEILGATFAAGDLPDVVELQTVDIVPYALSGKLVPIEDYIETSPYYAEMPKELIEAYRMADGHIYGFPQTRADGCVTYIRQDWLDKLGLDAPTTYDEFVAVLEAFTYDDPDGNGVDDTIGMTLPFNTGLEFDYYNRMIMQDAMFGFQQKDGAWTDGFLESEMAGALQRFRDLYAEGLIDSEFFSNKTSTARSKIYEGQAGMMEYWMGTWATRFDESAKNTNPDAVVTAIEPIENAFYVKRVVPVHAITVAAENPEAVFDAVVNTMLDKDAGQLLFTLGVEGIHYRVIGGKYEMLPEPANPERPFDKAFNSQYLIMNGWRVPVAQDDRVAKSGRIHDENSIQLGLPQGGEVYTKRVGELLTLKQEIFS
ncbi:MAG: extracellular solute-binding protein, partial [Spirochaetaceae bacterium]|nr:extracellular solute-binding protein [Spirochaetaceae bacterium]